MAARRPSPAITIRAVGLNGSSHQSLAGLDARRAFLAAALSRARAFHRALDAAPEQPCPTRVFLLGGDCLPTLARAIVPERPGVPPRFEPWTRAESAALFEAGDGRVPRASVLASHLPGAEHSLFGCGLPDVQAAFFGAADHHGIYAEPTFQSLLLRLLLRPARRAEARAHPQRVAAETA